MVLYNVKLHLSMLNQEQSDYIKSLKITHPNVDEGTMRRLLGGANWSESEINEALLIYSGTYQADHFVSSDQKLSDEKDINVRQVADKPTEMPILEDLNKQEKFKENIIEPNTYNTPSQASVKEESRKDVEVTDGSPSIAFGDEKESLTTTRPAMEDFSDGTDSVPQLDSEFKSNKGPDFGREIDIEVNEENIKESLNPSHKKPLNLIIIILLGIALLGCLAGIFYLAYQQISGGSAVQLNNHNILSTTLSKISEIKSANYKVEFGMSVNEREASARSVDQVFTVSEEERESLKRDKKRVEDVSKILSEIRMYDYTMIGEPDNEETKNYPSTLDFLSVSSTDPFGQPYLYELTGEEGVFNLTVEFETDSAINSIKKYDYYDSFVVDGKKVTFSDNSFLTEHAFDGKPEYPRIIESFAEGASGLEPVINSDTEITFAVDGGFDHSVKDSTDLRFGVSGEASFGDMIFALEAEFRKKAEDYYFIARKFPAFFGSFNAYKGEWVHFTQADIEEEIGFLDLGVMVDELNNGGGESVSNDYQAQFEEIIKTADKHGVFMIESSNKVMVDEKELTEYKLKLSRDNIVAFYEDISTKLATYEHPLIKRDDQIMEELRKEDSALAFDYINENITFSLFYDKKGFPVRYQIDIRYIPTEEAVNVNDKQVNVVISSTFTDINKKNEVEAPTEYIEVKDVIKEMGGYNNNIFLKNSDVFKYTSGLLQ